MTHSKINSLHFTVSDVCLRQDFKGQDHYSKVKSRSHHDVAHLHPLTNVSTKCRLPTPYGFQDIAWTRFSNSRSLQQGQRSNQGHIYILCPFMNSYNENGIMIKSI